MKYIFLLFLFFFISSSYLSCTYSKASKSTTMKAMFYSWNGISTYDSLGNEIEYFIDPTDSSFGHHLHIIGFYPNGLCSLEVLPFFVNKKTKDTIYSASDGGFFNAAGSYRLNGNSIFVSGKYYESYYAPITDSTWNRSFIIRNDTIFDSVHNMFFLRNQGYLRKRLTDIKVPEYLDHYDM